ncbi:MULTISPECIES: hypothetical protein [Crocosphaera]|uniref:Uncharacterized protein n=5 Tax=Crocosphaera watsonii TaxID=263511 RepID=T2JTW8_CROWT|nr:MULTISPECIES: hypothetical protein [Crocosphaera]EHJ15296.1 hypothetical protein CWATWH0003_0035 [Crocosphaera watsonii WH 0003]MCH2246632.1 hypothetical protein [Crocosphaera sp.]NQZ61899.1 hypothetical protein [Crocosphaera sp.]CCQ52118.1 FIG00567213: hypothetical protein [Crocosphaera watsonii WH 8502]CCQ59377.1 hypothetical protein CWATWH0005_425 [Crocosphaera watsonii WH 0005]
MAHHGIFMLLEKYPQLRPMIKEGRYLLGYTDGSCRGKQIQVFLLRSPWTQFCIWAATDEVEIPAGGVLLLTDDPEWSIESQWKAYSLVTPASSLPTQKNRRQKASKAVSPMTSLAAEIATEAAHQTRSRSRKMSPTT